MVQCSKCNRIILDSTPDGGWKLRTRMVLFDTDGRAKAICPSCKAHVPVNLALGDMGEALPKPKLFVNPS